LKDIGKAGRKRQVRVERPRAAAREARRYDSRALHCGPVRRGPIAMPSEQPDTGFAYSREQFQQIVDDALVIARRLGASDAGAEVSEGAGLSVSVRKGEVENVERNRDKSVGVAVYIGQRRGNASTSDFSKQALEQTVRAAYDIARFTAEDPAAGLPDERDLATPEQAAMDLDLFHPWAIDAKGAAELARRCEAAALATDKRITNSEGAGVSAQQSHFFAGNTRGFRGGYASSRHSLSVAPIAGRGADMQRDAWYTSERDARDMAAPEAVGRYAAERALSRLRAHKVPTCEVPVLFESTLASGLLGAYVQATSGGSLYRKASFLVDSLGQPVLADHIDIREAPHIPKGKGSAPFDDEGVATRARTVVEAGVVQGYFLSSYSARKLGMRTTGHAGGSQNLFLTSRRTEAGDDLDAMLRKLHRGLFVIELMGQGVNYVTGDYSRGAAGFWVENGRIVRPVQEVTIAGNLREMFRQIAAVGADAYTMGTKTIGSVLIERMKIAGS
jgi:PmbA protein